MIAASLKHKGCDESKSQGLPFPRSDDRGLIEALRWTLAPDSATYFRDQMIAASLKPHTLPSIIRIPSFPRSDDRGLIEARRPWQDQKWGCSFPRSDDRGLIEAFWKHIAACHDLRISAIR